MPFAIFSTAFSTERALIRLVALGCLCVAPHLPLAAEGIPVAVFPPIDRTGRAAPVEQIQETLEWSLSLRGFAPLPRVELEAFLRKHRIRHVGGISSEIAAAIGAETGVEGILLTAVDDWETVDPPRFALTSRWVAAVPDAPLKWMGTSAHHGHESPGAFGLGLVTSVEVLLRRSSDEISDSLAAALRATGEEDRGRVPGRFRPATVAIDPGWADAVVAGRPPRVAVLPFVVDAAWRDAGEMVASQFVRWLHATGRMEVLEPGIVREALLQARVIQEEGPSLPQVDALRALLDVDLVVSGRVTDYEAMGSSPGSPFIGFSARAIDARTRQAVWSSFSFGRGDDRIGPFGTARIRSCMTIASGLVRGAVGALEKELATRRPSTGAGAEKEGKR